MKKTLFLSALALCGALTATAQTSYHRNESFRPHSSYELNKDLHLVFGYVNKVWITETEDETYSENFWGEPDKRLHGMQFGLMYQPTLPVVGLGFRTGLAYEFYTSSSDYVEERGWDRFNEHCLYLPLHLVWDIRLGNDFAITPSFGLGFNWSMYGNFKDDQRYYYDDYYYARTRAYYGPHEYEHYGDSNPKRWNNQLEWGCDVRFGDFLIGFEYSKGIRNHELYEGYDTFQNKLQITLGINLEL